MRYLVWDPDNSLVEDARVVDGFDDPRDAAKHAAEHERDGWDMTWPVTYHVRDENGVTVAVEVEREPSWWYRAGEATPVPPEGGS